MPLSSEQQERIQRLFFIMVVGGAGLLGLGLFALNHFLIWQQSPPGPTATVTGKIYVTQKGYRTRNGGSSPASCALIYTVNGKEYTDHHTWCSWYGSGDDVSIIYQVADPSKSVLDSRSVGYLFGFIGALLTALSVLLGKHYLKRVESQESSVGDNSPDSRPSTLNSL